MSFIFSKMRSRTGEGTGDPRLTIALRKEFGEYAIDKDASSGGDRMTWEEWLRGKGYRLDKRGHVFKVETDDAER